MTACKKRSKYNSEAAGKIVFLKTTNLLTMDRPQSIDATPLLHVLSCLHPLTKRVEDYLCNHVRPMKVKKKKLLLREGTICNNVYFIRKGVIRGFTFEGQREITTWISTDNELVTSIPALDEPVPSLDNIQAIEDCELLMLSFEELNWLYEHYPEFNYVGRKLIQRYYGDAERRAYLARLNNAEDKYRYFLGRHEALSTRVPLRYIASYLGITLETLSRVRRRFARAPEGVPAKTEKKRVDRSQIIY